MCILFLFIQNYISQNAALGMIPGIINLNVQGEWKYDVNKLCTVEFSFMLFLCFIYMLNGPVAQP